jgi:ADP-heptose:LPS heptosyltransferase
MKVLICPGSAEDQKFKRWPTKNFKELILKLKLKNIDIQVILGPEEYYLKNNFQDLEIINSASFNELKLISLKSDLVICNDSFLMHFFCMLGRKVLALYGPTFSNRTLPPNAYKIENRGMPEKTPCWGTKNYGNCDNGRCSCFDFLNVNQVLKESLRILNL